MGALGQCDVFRVRPNSFFLLPHVLIWHDVKLLTTIRTRFFRNSLIKLPVRRHLARICHPRCLSVCHLPAVNVAALTTSELEAPTHGAKDRHLVQAAGWISELTVFFS